MDLTGPKFDRDLYLEARSLCIAATEEIIRRVEPGMTEKDGQALVKEVFLSKGVKKHWHPTKFRIGTDTLKNFREPTDETQITREGDVCFVDVGPVYENHEADFGRTFVVGNPVRGTEGFVNAQQGELILASEEIFAETVRWWQSEKQTGAALYEFAAELVSRRGLELNRKMAGHRLGDFPHQVYAERETLFGLERVPAADLWVLEIHVLDSRLQRGAFFEDILGPGIPSLVSK